MIKIAPSILSADFGRLAAEVGETVSADWVHVDVMDGHFVPNISLGAPVLKSLSAALPGLFYDVHLMIDRPLRYAADFKAAGASLITFHVESQDDPRGVISELRRLGVMVGITLKPGTPVEELLPLLPLVDMALVMTVEPGFGGQSFMPDMLKKVSALRAAADAAGRPDFLIEVDGGIGEKTAPQAAAAGANVLVAGSSVYGRPDRATAIEAIRRAALAAVGNCHGRS